MRPDARPHQPTCVYLMLAGSVVMAVALADLAQAVSISNVEPKLDQHGAIIELGDGSIQKFGDRYYWYVLQLLPPLRLLLLLLQVLLLLHVLP